MEEGSSTNLNELAHLEDPDRVKQKGRPALLKRIKPLIEEIRRKIAKEQKKKETKKQKLASKLGEKMYKIMKNINKNEKLRNIYLSMFQVQMGRQRR